jgi:hypothetical protein
MNYKFKAYDIKEKKWMFGCDYPNLGGFNLIGETILTGQLNSISLDKLYQDLVFFQYINIINNYGDEIYVGDVLMFQCINGESRFYKIFEAEGGFVFNVHQDDFKKPVDKIIFTESCSDMQSVGFLKQCKVVGNYIVSPELFIDKNLK